MDSLISHNCLVGTRTNVSKNMLDNIFPIIDIHHNYLGLNNEILYIYNISRYNVQNILPVTFLNIL